MRGRPCSIERSNVNCGCPWATRSNRQLLSAASASRASGAQGRVYAAITIMTLMALPLSQGLAQTFGPGETRYNAAMYKASHNSYSRDESLAAQIDDYNVWQIELDVYDYGGQLYINHDCDAPFDGASTLPGLLTKLVRESEVHDDLPRHERQRQRRLPDRLGTDAD